MSQAILLVVCPDQKGITASVTQFVFQLGGNIVDADQHVDDDGKIFFMRVTWDLNGFAFDQSYVEKAFLAIAHQFSMVWKLYFTPQKSRVAIFVSRQLHCLQDLLFRYQSGVLPCSIDLIVSNHMDAKALANQQGIDFLHVEVTADNKAQAEKVALKSLQDKNIDLVVLARYHQILSGDFLRVFAKPIINIHHSFLPAFAGGNPYLQAFQKGVKLIGATSHYVIEALDQGPIIEQDIARVSHKQSVQDLVELGRDLERVVLYRALRWHLEHKILTYGNKTVVFD